MGHPAASCSKGCLQWWGAGPTGDAAVTPLPLAALTAAPLDSWAEAGVNVVPHWKGTWLSEKPWLARDGLSRCFGCLDILRGRSLSWYPPQSLPEAISSGDRIHLGL